MSISSDYRRLQRSHSVPHIASRHDSAASGMTATTNTTTASCSLLDHIDYDSALCNEHPFNNQTRHYNKAKNHNYHHHNHHQQQHQHYDNVREKIRLFNCYTFHPHDFSSLFLLIHLFIAFFPHPMHTHTRSHKYYTLCSLHALYSRCYNELCCTVLCLVCWSLKPKKKDFFFSSALNFLLCIIHYTSKSGCSFQSSIKLVLMCFLSHLQVILRNTKVSVFFLLFSLTVLLTDRDSQFVLVSQFQRVLCILHIFSLSRNIVIMFSCSLLFLVSIFAPHGVGFWTHAHRSRCHTTQDWWPICDNCWHCDNIITLKVI